MEIGVRSEETRIGGGTRQWANDAVQRKGVINRWSGDLLLIAYCLSFILLIISSLC
jgi:hypothetical protein